MKCSQCFSSQSLSELSSELCSLLGLVTEDRPLTLVLDGLDNLSEEHEADLSWLSNTLLPNVFTVLSAGTQTKCAHSLQVGRCVIEDLHYHSKVWGR